MARPGVRPALSGLLALLAAPVMVAALLVLWPELRPQMPVDVRPQYFGRDVSGETWGGAFAMSDASGHQRTMAEMKGKLVLLAFGYTHCPDACPTTLARIAEVRRALGA